MIVARNHAPALSVNSHQLKVLVPLVPANECLSQRCPSIGSQDFGLQAWTYLVFQQNLCLQHEHHCNSQARRQLTHFPINLNSDFDGYRHYRFAHFLVTHQWRSRRDRWSLRQPYLLREPPDVVGHPCPELYWPQLLGLGFQLH